MENSSIEGVNITLKSEKTDIKTKDRGDKYGCKQLPKSLCSVGFL